MDTNNELAKQPKTQLFDIEGQSFSTSLLTIYKHVKSKKDIAFYFSEKHQRSFLRTLYVSADPTEHFDISASHPDVVQQLQQRLAVHRASMVPANFPPPDPASDPEKLRRRVVARLVLTALALVTCWRQTQQQFNNIISLMLNIDSLFVYVFHYSEKHNCYGAVSMTLTFFL